MRTSDWINVQAAQAKIIITYEMWSLLLARRASPKSRLNYAAVIAMRFWFYCEI